MPLQYAPSGQIEAFGPWAYEFVEEVTDLIPSFMSDNSAIRDFATSDEEFAEYIANVQQRYGVDVSDIERGNLVEVLTRVKKALPS